MDVDMGDHVRTFKEVIDGLLCFGVTCFLFFAVGFFLGKRWMGRE